MYFKSPLIARGDFCVYSRGRGFSWICDTVTDFKRFLHFDLLFSALSIYSMDSLSDRVWIDHHTGVFCVIRTADVVQLVRTPDCESGCRGFEPHHSPQRASFLKVFYSFILFFYVPAIPGFCSIARRSPSSIPHPGRRDRFWSSRFRLAQYPPRRCE